MEQHAVPREITSFQFKLIGFFTVKQFAYLVFFAGLAVGAFFIVPIILPIPFINILAAGIFGAMGAAMAMYKHNERELDVWIGNFISSLLSPQRFVFIKHNEPPDFLKGVFLYADTTTTHLDASEKLNKYVASTQHGSIPAQQGPQNEQVQTETPVDKNIVEQQVKPDTHNSNQEKTPLPSGARTPFLSGVVRNSKKEPLSNIMVYINTEAGQAVRILKTNHHGVFATFHGLPSGNYALNPKDLGGTYFFDTMKLAINGKPSSPIDIYSKELL